MQRAQGETSDCSRHFGWNDFDCARLDKTSTECPLQGCSATLLRVPYGDQSKSDRTLRWCPEHGIRLHSDTFVYWNGPDPRDEARLRNFIVSPDLVRRIALPKGMKAEAHRLGFEMSEDALSWNVFQSLAVAGKLREATKFLTGCSLSSTPHLYLWGRRIDGPEGKHELYAPLCQVRAKLEPDISTFVTEPDIMLVAERELVVCIEAKFGSGNPLAHDSALPVKGKKPTSRPGLIARYLGNNTSERTRRIVLPETTPHSQLFRNIVFASEMAQSIPWHVVNLVSDTQKGANSKDYSYDDPTEEIRNYLHPDRRHCFTYRTWEAFHEEVISHDADLATLDQYLRNKSAHFRRAFALDRRSPQV